jgi:hypothetical protein
MQTSGFLTDPPRPGAIFLVIARPLVHDLRPVKMPIGRIFMIQTQNPFRIGRERAESCAPRKVEGNYLP